MSVNKITEKTVATSVKDNASILITQPETVGNDSVETLERAAFADVANKVALVASANTAPMFDSAVEYKAGQYVIYTDGKLYQLTSDHAAGVAWADIWKAQVTTAWELTGLKNAVNYTLKSGTLPTSVFEQGSISATNGSNGGSSSSTYTQRIRTSGYLSVPTAGIVPAAEFCVAAFAYDADDSYAFKGVVTKTGVRVSPGPGNIYRTDFIDLRGLPSNYKIRIGISAIDNHDITPASAYDKALFYYATDASLTQPNCPADAKAVGDAIVDAIGEVESDISDIQDDIDTLNGAVFKKDYIQAEADRVASKVRAVQTGKSLTFVAVSDLHYNVLDDSSGGVMAAASQAALADMRDGIKAIAEQLHIDFYVSFGDMIYQWQNHGADYDNGVQEAVGVTRLINDAFGIAPQIRMVGNHDPNCENALKEFTANMLNSFCGAYSEMLEKDEAHAYGGYGLHDFDRQKIRLIVLNTSYYTPEDDIGNNATRYYISKEQADWFVDALDLSSKSDASSWQIVIFSHVVMDITGQKKIYPYTDILAKYESGSSGSTTVDSKTTSYNFNGKNAATLALYMNGHEHKYDWKNMRKIVSGSVNSVLKMANLHVPNGLPGRELASGDGVTYSKTADSATSTAFQVVTIDPVNRIVYAHHYGAGIDVVMHYGSQAVTASTELTTALTAPAWASLDTAVATVSNGTVAPVATGNTMIWAKSSDDNCVEVWNVGVTV